MTIHDSVRAGSETSRILKNPIALELACLWNAEHNDSIQNRRRTLIEGWRQIDVTKRIHSRGENIFSILIICSIFVAAILSSCATVNIWMFVSIMAPFIAAMLITVIVLKITMDKLNAYFHLADPLWDFNEKARDILYDYDPKKIHSLNEIRDFIEYLCIEIVRMESSETERSFIFPNPISNDGPALNLPEFKQQVKKMIVHAAALGVVTGDLTIHFKNAEVKWLERCSTGEIPVDYSI